MKIYFDASVIIAAVLSPTGGSALLFQFVKKGYIYGISSQTTIAEIIEEGRPEKMKKTISEIHQFINENKLIITEHITEEEIRPHIGKIDIEDAHLIAAATLTKCDYLVSLDKKHLLRADIKKIFLPLRIVNPKELLEELAVT